MRRREFITLIGGAATSWPLAARAQQPSKIPVVGVLWVGSAEKELANPFQRYLHDEFGNLGYISDKTVNFEERYADGTQDRYDQLASELVALNPDVMIALTLSASMALKKATSRIPIAFLGVPDPVGSGLVASIARPGGNVTGMAAPQRETYSMRVEIFKQLIPGLSRLALLADLDEPSHVAIEREYYMAAAAANGIQLEVFSARDEPTINETFTNIVRAKYDGVIIANQGVFYLLRDELSAAALSNRLPTMAPGESFVPSGVLIAYSPDLKFRFVESCHVRRKNLAR